MFQCGHIHMLQIICIQGCETSEDLQIFVDQKAKLLGPVNRQNLLTKFGGGWG